MRVTIIVEEKRSTWTSETVDGFFYACYLRLAEISVGQSAPQPREASRSAFSHTAKPTSTTTVTTSLARVRSLILPTFRANGGPISGAVHDTTIPPEGKLLVENSANHVRPAEIRPDRMIHLQWHRRPVRQGRPASARETAARYFLPRQTWHSRLARPSGHAFRPTARRGC
jgi:hypothetical protein